jgi:hypothetical protein
MSVNELITYFTSPTFGFLLKLFAGLATAGFGLLGVGAKTREDNGHLNRSGWIALIGITVAGALAISTSVYEFATGQTKERADRRRSERLMLSVQRGVYPMRGVKVSFEMMLAGDFLGIVAYKKSVRDQISQDRLCKEAALGFVCSGFDIDGRPEFYRIDRSSPLFPRNHSPMRHILENLYVHVSLYKGLRKEEGSSKDAAGIKYLGRFLVAWWEGLPKNIWLTYDYIRNTLAFSAEDYPLTDEIVAEAGVYSLVDFIPGMIAAIPRVSDDRLCERLQLGVEQCVKEILDPLDLSLLRFRLAFPYPKNLRATAGDATHCTTGKGEYLVLRLPDDIEAIDSLGNMENFRQDAMPGETCGAIKE